MLSSIDNCIVSDKHILSRYYIKEDWTQWPKVLGGPNCRVEASIRK